MIKIPFSPKINADKKCDYFYGYKGIEKFLNSYSSYYCKIK